LAVFGIVNLANIQVPAVNTSTATGHPSFSWAESYPPANQTAGSSTRDTSQTILLQVKVSANQTITEGTPVTLTVGGSEGAFYFLNASSIYVGFFGADDPNSFVKGPSGTGFAGVSLFPSSKPTAGTNLSLNAGNWLEGPAATIKWQSPGEQPLSVVIVLTNATQLGYTYQKDVVVVSSADSLRGSQVLLGAAALALGAFLFAIFDVVPRVREGRQRSALKGSKTRRRS
jgi:hypothetical protein